MSEPTEQRIRDIIAGSDVVLFMKGVPAAPQCGFSGAVVQILNGLGVPFTGINVLADPDIREGIKSFSNWPTIPSTSRASFSAAATSCARCSSWVSWPQC